MRAFAETAEKIAATTKKLEKTALLSEYLKSAPVDQAVVGAVFFSGRPFPTWEETTLQVGGTLLWRTVQELSGQNEEALTAAYRKLGDLGAVAGAALPQPCSDGRPRPSKIQQIFREIAAARGPAAKGILVRKLLSEVSPLEAKYIVKIMTGDLRIGLKESLVEEAIAKGFGESLKEVQRANMLLGDIGETLRLAAENKLPEAKMRLFHPIGFMLASPAESAEDTLNYFQNARVEDKYDGIRAQAHCSGDTVRFFSRTRDEITESFPELPDALVGLPQDAILDGEIVAWSYLSEDELESEVMEVRAPTPVQHLRSAGRALPFSALQQRLGRKKVSDKVMREVPVAYLVFDVLYASELMIDRPLRERAGVLDELLSKQKRESQVARGESHATQTAIEFPVADPVLSAEDLWLATPDVRRTTKVIRAPVFQVTSPDDLNKLFDQAQARGNEGLMIKDPESPYT